MATRDRSVTSMGKDVRGAEFGDRRLTQRLVSLVERLATQPDASFPSVLNEAELEGAYRFFSNASVTSAAVLAPHVRETVDRCSQEAVTLALHDTTVMSFRADGQRSGFGGSRGGTQKFFAHFTLGISADGSRRPHGVLDLSIHPHEGTAEKRERWIAQVGRVTALLDPARTVHLMDREADDYGLFAELRRLGTRAVVRMQYNRFLASPGPGEPRKLNGALEKAVVLETREVPISRHSVAGRGPRERKAHPARKARLAKLAVGAMAVSLQRPTTADQTLDSSLRVNVVRVWEVDAPAGETPIEWMLFTTEPIETPEQVLQIVDWYRARWVIEEYFKALKTGCAYEKRQLEDLHALGNALAVFAPIAWKLLLLRSEARCRPDEPATTVLPSDELEVLTKAARRPLPANPTVRDVFIAIAALGGHLKRNGDPGWQTLARGYEKLVNLTAGWNLHKQGRRSTKTYDQS
jgi:hypothetical protein